MGKVVLQGLFVVFVGIAVAATVGADGEMAVPAVAAVVNEVIIQPFRNLEQTVLIEVQRPQMVLQVEICP